MNTRLENASKQYTKKSFMAFLEGESHCTENWLKGIIRASTSEAIKDALDSLSLSYEESERFGVLRRACEVA